MADKEVYVVRHYGYDHYEFESLIGLASTKEVAERMARINEHVYREPTITYSFSEHAKLARDGLFHVYIELRRIEDEYIFNTVQATP